MSRQTLRTQMVPSNFTLSASGSVEVLWVDASGRARTITLQSGGN